MMLKFSNRILGLLPVACAIFGLGLTAPALGQTASPAVPIPQQITSPLQVKPQPGIILKENTDEITLENNFYVIHDPEKNLSLRLITEKFANGTLGSMTAPSPLIDFGLTSMTSWIVIPITNVSTSDLWELDFGDSLTGRQTFFSRLSIYSSFNRSIIFDSSPQDHPVYSIERRMRFHAPIGQSGFIVIEARNPSGSLMTTSLSLRRAYQADTNSSWLAALMKRIPLLAATILLSAAVLRRSLSYGAFGLAWALIYFQFYLIDHYIFFSGISPQLLTPLIWMLVGLLLIGGFWATEEGREEFPASLFLGVGFLSLVFSMLSLLVSDFVPLAGSILSYGPFIAANILLIALSWPVFSRGHDRSFFFLLTTGLFLLLSSLPYAALASGLIPGAQGFLPLSAIFFCIAATCHSTFALLSAPLTPAIPVREAVDEPVAPVKLNDFADAKENSEHKRLMQVLDQERATMGQMQVQEARRTEEMRKAKEAADEANNAKSAFLAVVSHEIRTPMTGVMGMVKLLLDTTLSKEQKDYAVTIQDSGEALMALLNDILDFEKIESGKLELERTDFDLHRLLRGVQTLMNGHAAAKNVELRLELDPRAPQFIVGDSTRLRQVLLNLVNNAIKFTSKGTVYLRINDLTPEDKIDGPHQLYFAVQDSGIGITPETQKKLFMPFAQADSSTARKYGGTGLGLAICKRLIEAMGGSINISSKPNEGSTFFFTIALPLGHEAGAQKVSFVTGSAPNEPVAQKPSRRLEVLVVDDNGINQKVLTGLVEKEGHRVAVASTGAEAMGKHLAATYDLILMDIELPDKSGIEVTREIRRLPDKVKAFLPIVAMTGNTSEKDIINYFNAGMDDFLGKPITVDKLRAILLRAAGTGAFANLVQKEMRQGDPAPPVAQAAPVVDDPNVYVPMPPPPRPVAEIIPVQAQGIIPQAVPVVPGFAFPELGSDADNDDDSFDTAIRQFEEMAQTGGGSSIDSDLDEAILGSLKNSLNAKQMDELLMSYYEKAEELVTVIGETYLSGDFEALRARAHELKGMAGNFGFKGVGDLASQIEAAARDKKEPELLAPVQKIAETYALSKARLAAWLKE